MGLRLYNLGTVWNLTQRAPGTHWMPEKNGWRCGLGN